MIFTTPRPPTKRERLKAWKTKYMLHCQDEFIVIDRVFKLMHNVRARNWREAAEKVPKGRMGGIWPIKDWTPEREQFFRGRGYMDADAPIRRVR